MTKVIHLFELPNKNVKKNKLFSDAQKKPTDEVGFQTKQLMKRDANVVVYFNSSIILSLIFFSARVSTSFFLFGDTCRCVVMSSNPKP